MTYHITIHESLPYEVHKEASSLREREREAEAAGWRSKGSLGGRNFPSPNMSNPNDLTPDPTNNRH
jgi:hypothetical protein